jgi:hypothetical protein
MSNSTIADDLKAARALIEKGWCKDALRLGNTYCAIGALSKVTEGDVYACTSRGDAAYHAVRKMLPAGVDIADFNNAPETTRQDVLNLFDKALAELGALA